jgi:RimJ/RimL family protein N-acetyltransferase
MKVTMSFEFRPFTFDDLPLMLQWVQRPHVRRWWGADETLASLTEHYGPRITGEDSTRLFIAQRHGRAIGFCQRYVVVHSADDGWWPDETDPGARGVDQFLADESSLGRGIGSAMVRAFVDSILADPQVTVVQTDPSPANIRAVRSYLKAGFHAQRLVQTPDGPALLMRRWRDRP